MRARGETFQEIFSRCMEVRLFTETIRHSPSGLWVLIHTCLLRLSHDKPLCLPWILSRLAAGCQQVGAIDNPQSRSGTETEYPTLLQVLTEKVEFP